MFNGKTRVVPKESIIEVLLFEIQIKNIVFIKFYKEIVEKYWFRKMVKLNFIIVVIH